MATKKEVINPIASKWNSLKEKLPALLNKSYPVAAAMVGIANKKENSTMASRLIPISNPPTIVAPERDTPGIIANDCQTPVKKDFLSLIWLTSARPTRPYFLCQSSNKISSAPPTNNDQSTKYTFESKYCFRIL